MNAQRKSAALTRLTAAPRTSTTGYPWVDGDLLYAADLNAAIAQSLPLTGGTVSGPVDAPTFTNASSTRQVLATTLTPSISISAELSGTLISGPGNYSKIEIFSDTVNVPTGGGVTGFRVTDHCGGVGTVGNRVGQFIDFSFAGGDTNKSLGLGSEYAGLFCYATASGNVGGTPGIGNGWGTLWGGVASAVLNSGATNWDAAVGLEVDVGVGAGASAARTEGLKIVLAHHTQPPLPSDYLLGFGASQDCSQRINTGISIGSADGFWPVDINGSIFSTIRPNATLPGYPGPPYACAYGIDLSQVTFSTAFLKSTGFMVDGLGHVFPLLTNAANDAAAAAAGIPIGALYRNGGAVMVRLA